MQIDLCTYNIRGLNNKQSFVKDFLESQKLSFIVLLETHVQENRADAVAKFIGPKLKWIFNYDHHQNGRIWIGYNPSFWKVLPLSSSAQHISCNIFSFNSKCNFYASFVYACNSHMDRRDLWNCLLDFKNFIPADSSWCIVGDFNVCLGPNETSNGNTWTSSMLEFKDFLSSAGLSDLRTLGPLYTWWDCNITMPVFKRLDRCVVNGNWLCSFSNAQANILQRGLSDHSPIAIYLGCPVDRVPKPFQFFNHLIQHERFLETVKHAWSVHISGDPWFILTQKLKLTKSALRNLNMSNGNVHSKVMLAKHDLLNFQKDMSSPPSSSELIMEKNLIGIYSRALLEEETFLKQKARVKWLKCGDSNSSFFFNSCKNRWNHNKILQLQDNDGNFASSHKDIAFIAVNYFSDLLGHPHPVSDFPENLPVFQISDSQANDLQQPFAPADVFNTIKAMSNNKSPGPDGFTVEFYISTWDILGEDVTNAVLHFFNSLHLPRIINSTALALVPKCSTPTSMNDYRPIACCNVLYKCISKMLSARLKKVISTVVSPLQSAFVPGRKIGDNILLAQALFKDYHLNGGPPRCAFKIDLRKAFDTLNWRFIDKMLSKMGFPAIFKNWIMSCITGSMLSVKINGSLEGYFSASSGLRQGDPISPFLFVMAMEILTAYVNNRTLHTDFKHHWRTKDMNITHITFADDILMFSHGDLVSANIIIDSLKDFSLCSGMHINPSKCQFFASSISNDIKVSILQSSGFVEGALPVSYLGLPLISSKLSQRHCLPLIAKVRGKIDSWVHTCLNQAGRLQLIKAVLYGIQGYWSAHLLLPKCVLKQIQSLMMKFLWGGSSDNSKLIKVSWSDCCLPKNEGGLGLRDLCQWNTAAFLFHLWRITQPSNDSLWIMWFKRTILKRKALWTMNIPNRSSWCVRKILNLRPLALRYIKYCVGRHSGFLLWHDPWAGNAPLLKSCHPTTISLAESNSMALVSSFIENSSWNLPPSNHLFVQELRAKICRIPINACDTVTWQNLTTGDVKVSTIWQSIRSNAIAPAWLSSVWHDLSIPKCAFTFWLALKGRLLTKDRMQRFRMDIDLKCVLCQHAIETHDHLFGTCQYITEILNANSFNFTGIWGSYMNGQYMLGNITGIRKRVGLLYLAVSVYLTWRERNDRLHDINHKMSAKSTTFRVKQMLREKLHSNRKFQQAFRKDSSIIFDLY